jgi:hypothetical protein
MDEGSTIYLPRYILPLHTATAAWVWTSHRVVAGQRATES